MSMLQRSSSRATSAFAFVAFLHLSTSKALTFHVANGSFFIICFAPLVLESHQPRCADQESK